MTPEAIKFVNEQIRPAIISIITAGVIGGGVLTLKPEPVSADQIAEVVRQVIKETNNWKL